MAAGAGMACLPGAARPRRGVALIAVLWVVLLLAVIAGSLTLLTRAELGLSRNLVLSARAEALAEGGVWLAIGRMLADPAGDGRITGAQAWRFELEDGVVDVLAVDSTALIDLNMAPEELLSGLFRAAGAAEDEAAILAARIADWRDSDDNPRADGAEQADYAEADPPVRVGNRPFATADEILRVPGVTLALWRRIEGAVTVHSGRPGINPLYAPALALAALPGMDAETVQAIVAARPAPDAGMDGAAGTPADRQSLAELVNTLPPEARRYLTGGSANKYLIRARAEPAGGGIYVLETVAELAPAATPPWRIHEWRPGMAE